MRVAVAIAAAASTLAVAAGDAAADAKSEAEALFRAGEQAFDTAKYGDAAQAFEQAYAKLPLPAIAFSTAQAHRLQYFIDHQPQHLQRAVELYHLYIDAQKTGGRIADATTNLAQIEPLYAQLRAAGALAGAGPAMKAATALMVTADVADARVTIDDELGTAPFTHDVQPGDHHIVVEAAGYVRYERVVEALADRLVPVEAHMVAEPARVTIRAPGGARLSIDGRLVGETPLPTLDVDAGTHLFAITDRGHVPFTRQVVLARGAPLQLDAALPPTTQREVARWVLVGSGTVAVAAGITGIAALSADSAAAAELRALHAGDAPSTDVTRYNDLRDERDERVTATCVLGGAAVAIAVTALALYLFDEPVASGHF
jgi:hypothetical protein